MLLIANYNLLFSIFHFPFSIFHFVANTLFSHFIWIVLTLYRLSNSLDAGLRVWDINAFFEGESRCLKLMRGHKVCYIPPTHPSFPISCLARKQWKPPSLLLES